MSQDSHRLVAHGILMAACLLAAGLAGCVTNHSGGTSSPAPSESTPIDALETSRSNPAADRPWTLTCPHQGKAPLCATTFGLPGTRQLEPFLAIDPFDDRRMALAFMETQAVADQGGVAPLALTLHTSDDGGQTWTQANHPGEPEVGDETGIRLENDPTLAFGPSGRLHMAWLASPSLTLNGDSSSAIAYAFSDDFGLRWSATHVFRADGGSDRPWLGVDSSGDVTLVWQQPTLSPQTTKPPLRLASSHDRGETWSVATRAMPACNVPSEPVMVDGQMLLTCTSWANDEADTLVLHVGQDLLLDVRAQVLPGIGCGTGQLSSGGGILAFACRGGAVAISADNGHTWTPPTWLYEAFPPDGPWYRIYWMEVDSTGHVHILRGNKGGDGTQGLEHLVLNRTLNKVAPSTTLAQSPVAPPFAGHFDALATGQLHGALAWEDPDNRIRILHLHPPQAEPIVPPAGNSSGSLPPLYPLKVGARA